MFIRSIFKDKYYVILVKCFIKSVFEVLIEGLLEGVIVLESFLKWYLVSEVELVVLELVEGILVS